MCLPKSVVFLIPVAPQYPIMTKPNVPIDNVVPYMSALNANCAGCLEVRMVCRKLVDLSSYFKNCLAPKTAEPKKTVPDVAK